MAAWGLRLIVVALAIARVKREDRVRFGRWRTEHREELGQLVRGGWVQVSSDVKF